MISVSNIVSTYPVSSIRAPNAASGPPEPEDKTIALSKEYIALLLKQWQFLSDDEERRVATAVDLGKVENALRHIALDAGATINDSAYQEEITLDPGSPAAATGHKTMKIWELLVHYGICKEGDKKPATQDQLKDLISQVGNKNSSIASISQTKQLDMKRLADSRQQANLLIASLNEQRMNTLRAILKLM